MRRRRRRAEWKLNEFTGAVSQYLVSDSFNLSQNEKGFV